MPLPDGSGAGHAARLPPESRGENRWLLTVLVLGFLLIPLSRLPQLLGGPVFPDGDESILALMAKHLMEGKRVPLLFYGQSYGLAIFEAGTVAVAFALFGVSNLSLKCAMLFLWSLGWSCFVLAAYRWAGKRAAGVVAVSLIACPAWASLSMKAFGGYVTAFLFTGLLLWLCARLAALPRGSSALGTGLLGVVAGIILLAQPLWLPPSLTFVAIALGRRSRGADFAAFAAGFAGVVTLFLALTTGTRSAYWTPDILQSSAPLMAVVHLPQRVWTAMSGAYWMNLRLPSGHFTDIAAALWVILWLGAVVVSIVQWRRGQRLSPLIGSVVAVIIASGASLVLNDAVFMYRYLSAASALLAFGVALTLAQGLEAGIRAWRRGAAACLAALVCTGTLSLAEFRRVETSGIVAGRGHSVGSAFAALLAGLHAADVRHVYSTDPMLQWSIMFASREEVIARWVHPSDRVPAYPLAVDRALRAGQRVAVVGWAGEASRMDLARRGAGPRASTVANTFSVLLYPDPATVRRLGFRLND